MGFVVHDSTDWDLMQFIWRVILGELIFQTVSLIDIRFGMKSKERGLLPLSLVN